MSTPEAVPPHPPVPQPHRGGFDVILGNPPWERVKLQEQEFFAQKDPTVAGAPNAAARKKAIAALEDTNPALLKAFKDAARQAEGESHLMRSSGRYPLCGRGDINTYAVFAESMRDALSPTGRLGVIVPTGIATDDTTKFFFGDMVESRTLVSYFGFKNERFLFPRPVEHTVTFGLLTVVGRALSSEQMQFCWLAWTVEEMNDPARRIVLTADDIDRLNPNTRTCPVFRSERDAEITKAIYRRVPVLIREARDEQPEANPWGLTFMTMFHMSNASGLFVAPEVACPAVAKALSEHSAESIGASMMSVEPSTRAESPSTSGVDPSTKTKEGPTTTVEGATTTKERSMTIVKGATTTVDPSARTVDMASLRADGASIAHNLREWPFLPLYEAKMLHQFDHRWATYARPGVDWLTTPVLTKISKDGNHEPDTRDITAAEKDHPGAFSAPRYWVKTNEVEARLIKTDKEGNVTWRWERDWLLGFRDTARNTDDRTLIATVVPRVGISNKIPLMVFDALDANLAAGLIACMNSFVTDYAARQKIGGATLNFFIVRQFPVLPPSTFAATCLWDTSTSLVDWIAPRVLELVYTAHDLAGFARDLGYDGLPFRWNVARRAQIRAELDAAFFHLYGVSHDDAAYILDTFLVFKARDEERNGGVYKTKQTILGIYDAMAEAMNAVRAARPTPVAAPAFLPPTRTQVQKGRAPAYLTLLAATWAKPVERQAIEYGLVLMFNDALRARVLAQTRATKAGGGDLFPTHRAAVPASSAPATKYVQGLDTMIGLLNTNNILKVTNQGGTQRIELGSAGAAAAQSLPQTDRTKAKDAVAAFEILRANLQRMESFADAKDLEFSVT